MKTFIRVVLCLGSSCIIAANWGTLSFALLAGCLFLLGNVMSLLYNMRSKRIEPPTTKRMRSLMM